MSKGEVVASLNVEETVGTVDITSMSSDYVFHTNCNTNVAVIPQNTVEVDGIVHDCAEADIHRTIIFEKAVMPKQKYTMAKCEYCMKLDSKLPLPV